MNRFGTLYSALMGKNFLIRAVDKGKYYRRIVPVNEI